MINRFMRILVFFDLPTLTKKDKRNYSKFRKFLLQDGYEMLQLSVYSRISRNHDDATKHIQRIKKNLPPIGAIRAMIVTEKQYASMLILLGNRTLAEEELATKELVVI